MERWFNPDAQCVTYIANELAYGRNSEAAGRLFWVPEANIWLQLDGQQADLALDELVTQASPLFDAMTITAG